MLQIIKEFVVVIVIAATFFRLAQPLALQFISAEDFRRRRNVWFAITFILFAAPSFLTMSLGVIPVLIWAGKRETNPAAFFLMFMNVVPPVSVRIPMIGISYLLDATFYLFICVFVMVPAARRLKRDKTPGRERGVRLEDICIFSYVMLRAVHFVHPEVSPGVLMTPTVPDNVRRIVDYTLNILVPYYVISRCTRSRSRMLDALASFCLIFALMSVIALFERERGWLLYANVSNRLSGADANHFLLRDGYLRGMASTGHSLSLGTLLALACGFFLGLQGYFKAAAQRTYTWLVYGAGLLATYSRGPWLGAFCIFMSFNALRPGAMRKAFKTFMIVSAVAGVILISPLGDSIVRVLPFMGGTVDSGNIDYRVNLQARMWDIIQASPTLGDPYALLKMQDLRQGEGIIDLVNGYAVVLLSNGFVGLGLLLLFLFIGCMKAWSASRQFARMDDNFGLVGISLLACVIGLLILMDTGGVLDALLMNLGALCLAYAYIDRRAQRAVPQNAPLPFRTRTA